MKRQKDVNNEDDSGRAHKVPVLEALPLQPPVPVEEPLAWLSTPWPTQQRDRMALRLAALMRDEKDPAFDLGHLAPILTCAVEDSHLAFARLLVSFGITLPPGAPRSYSNNASSASWLAAMFTYRLIKELPTDLIFYRPSYFRWRWWTHRFCSSDIQRQVMAGLCVLRRFRCPKDMRILILNHTMGVLDHNDATTQEPKASNGVVQWRRRLSEYLMSLCFNMLQNPEGLIQELAEFASLIGSMSEFPTEEGKRQFKEMVALLRQLIQGDEAARANAGPAMMQALQQLLVQLPMDQLHGVHGAIGPMVHIHIMPVGQAGPPVLPPALMAALPGVQVLFGGQAGGAPPAAGQAGPLPDLLAALAAAGIPVGAAAGQGPGPMLFGVPAALFGQVGGAPPPAGGGGNVMGLGGACQFQ